MVRRLCTVAVLGAAVLLAFAWWSTAVSTSMARIAAMQPIEAYAFAVYHQIVHNLAMQGVIEQTIHQGYDVAWTWSGHRAPALFTTALLYRLDGGAFGLARMQILQVLTGVVPAALLGRRAVDGHVGGVLLGVGLYLLTPAVIAMSLQDYQDLVLAVPFLLWLAAALRARHWAWVVPGVLLALLPREETVPLAVGMAAVVVPWTASGGGSRRVRWRRWGLNLLLVGGIAGAYAALVQAAYPATETAYQMPLASAVGGIGGDQGIVFLDGWPFAQRFYRDLLIPTGALGLLAPLVALPGAALTVFHMAIPGGHGIDRSWGGHCHHLAPAVPFLVLASIDGAGRALRLLARAPGGGWVRRMLVGIAGLALAGWVGLGAQAYMARQNVRVSLVPLNPAWVHPAWDLLATLPADAVPAVPKDLAPAVADRRIAYSLDGSLGNKAPEAGLGAATHALVDTRQEGIEPRVARMPGVELIGADGPFRLYTWTPGANDRTAEASRRDKPRKARPWLGPYKRRDDIPGVPPFESGKVPEGSPPPPSIRLPW
ncbi:MAG: DUF2079 domain-containing protein [Myxococcota bacterium]|nr:DUF2079 domain-containing protein [Myxococcota bacterium]